MKRLNAGGGLDAAFMPLRRFMTRRVTALKRPPGDFGMAGTVGSLTPSCMSLVACMALARALAVFSARSSVVAAKTLSTSGLASPSMRWYGISSRSLPVTPTATSTILPSRSCFA